VVFLVVFFKSSDNLAAAYGIAVASTMLLTTLLMYFITHSLWKWSPLATFVVIGPLALVDAVFVSSNVSKVAEGGWFPLLAGGVLFTVMTTWHRGRELVVERMKTDNIPLAGLIQSLCGGCEPPRVEGTAVFPGGVAGMTPSAFMHNLKHNRVMHGTNIFMAGMTENVPHVHDEEKITVENMGYGCYAVNVLHGDPERAGGFVAGRQGDPRLGIRAGGHLVLPCPRYGACHRREQGNGAVAREAVCVPRPQCGAGGRVLQLAGEPCGRTGRTDQSVGWDEGGAGRLVFRTGAPRSCGILSVFERLKGRRRAVLRLLKPLRNTILLSWHCLANQVDFQVSKCLEFGRYHKWGKCLGQ
jgi:hypothetical protein